MGAVHRPDGTKTARIEKDYHEGQWREVGKLAAGEIMASEVGKMIAANIQELRKEK